MCMLRITPGRGQESLVEPSIHATEAHCGDHQEHGLNPHPQAFQKNAPGLPPPVQMSDEEQAANEHSHG